MVCIRLSSTHFYWSILEYFVQFDLELNKYEAVLIAIKCISARNTLSKLREQILEISPNKIEYLILHFLQSKWK